MSQLLLLHPESRCSAIEHIEVEVRASCKNRLMFSYVVRGRISDIRIPARASQTHHDNLWRHTCFEAFVRCSTDDAYYEFNFSPSTEWAAYHFTHYRSGMRQADEVALLPPKISRTADCYSLQAVVEFRAPSGLPPETRPRVGLSAVVEEVNGNKSYWALAHPTTKPDFHHAASFKLELPTNVES